MTEEELIQQVHALYDRIEASDGGRLAAELRTLHRTNRVFLGNDAELRRHVGVHVSDFGVHDRDAPLSRPELFDARHSERFEVSMDAIDRLLHNYLASATTLLDKARRIWNEFTPENAGLQAEYEQRVESLMESPLGEFVEALRPLTVHRQLPSVAGHRFWSPGEEPTFDSATPLKRLWWRKFDDALPGEPRYRPPNEYLDTERGFEEGISEYTAEVQSHISWIVTALTDSHRAALEEHNRLIAEHDTLHPNPLLEPVASSEAGKPDGEQAVIFHLVPGPGFDLEQVEEGLESAADEVNAEYDGNGVALDGSLVDFFLYGEDADVLFDAAAPIIRRAATGPGSYAVKRYGNADDDPPAHEERIDL